MKGINHISGILKGGGVVGDREGGEAGRSRERGARNESIRKGRQKEAAKMPEVFCLLGREKHMDLFNVLEEF